jgi:hypothetical protein
MGAARICESAIMTGNLQHLTVTGTCLGYRFCTTLHAILRTKVGNTVTDLVLQGCGLGGHLEQELSDLPQLVAATYSKGLAALPEGIIGFTPSTLESATTEEQLDKSDMVEEVTAPLPAKPTAESEPPKVERRARKGRQEEEERKAAEEKRRDEDEEQEGAEAENVQAVEHEEKVEPPWWEFEKEPARKIPVALPLVLHLARPGSGIRRLDLSTSALSIEMGKCLGWALNNSPMEALILDQCSINDESLIALTKGLGQNRLLLELSLRGNQLSGAPEPINELIHIAGRHASLAHLDFAENPLHQDCIQELVALMEYSCSVLAIHLLGQGIGGPDAVIVARACRDWLDGNDKSQDLNADSTAKEEVEEDTFGEDEEELVLCRARHVDALTSWRITSPANHRTKKKAIPACDKVENITAPLSWMPSGCWICKKCATVNFRFVVPDRGEGDESGSTGSKLFLRPSFNDYSRIEMQREQSAGRKRVAFWSQVLVPPGVHNYLFESVCKQKKKILLHSREQPTTELANLTLKDGESVLLNLCKEYTYNGKINTLPPVKETDFKIPEHLEGEKEPPPEVDPWAEDPVRKKALRECFEADLPDFRLDEICHIEEEDEVQDTIWELYGHFYDTYAIYAGRSRWPLIRQVEVYSFFEEARLLDRGPLTINGPSASLTHDLRKMAAATSAQATSQPSSPAVGAPGGNASPAATPVNNESSRAASLPRLKAAAHPLTTQDVQQMIVQTITRRKHQLKADASWATRRKCAVEQCTREGKPITRPQFVEVLLRAAVALRGREPSTSVALRKFTENILSGRIFQPPLSPFPRGLALQACVVRDTLLARWKTLRQAYERFGSNETSFQRLAQLLKLCDRSFTAKHVASIYALSRRPMKTSLQSANTGLLFEEFSEAVARFALIWQPTVGIGAVTSPGSKRDFPPQPRVGHPVRHQAVANKLEAFLERLTERMKPSVVSNPSLAF